MPVFTIMSPFQSDSIILLGHYHPWVHGWNVWWTILRAGLTALANMVSKFTALYHKIWLAKGITKLFHFPRTNSSTLQLKLGTFSKSSAQGLSGLYLKIFHFSPTRSHWAELVIELPCLCVCVCLSVCMCHCKTPKGHIANIGLQSQNFTFFYSFIDF